MDPLFITVFKRAAAKDKFKVHASAITHLMKYDSKWKSKFKNKWNTPLIQAVLADSAIKIAKLEGRKVIADQDIRNAVWAWHTEGQMNNCYNAGLNIVKHINKKQTKVIWNPKISSYLKKGAKG